MGSPTSIEPNRRSVTNQEAVISNVQLGAAHEGHAELLITLTYPTGGQTVVPLDPTSCAHLMDLTGAGQVEDLIGTTWQLVRDAIQAAHQ